MSQRSTRNEASQALIRAERALGRWRRRHGGRGIRIPEDLWALALEAAREEGVDPAARTLRMSREGLLRRMEPSERAARSVQGDTETGASAFVELRMGETDNNLAAYDLADQGGARAMVEMLGGNGEQMRIVLNDACDLDVAGLVRAFWSR